MKKVLVTGGLGFVGSTLVKKLKQEGGYDITVMDNLSSPSSNASYKEEGVKYIIDDILNIDNVFYKDLSFDIIYHLAGLARIQPSFKNPVKYFYNNTFGTVKICDLARRCNAKIIYAGSSSAYSGTMNSPYAYAKYNGEEICKLFSIDLLDQSGVFRHATRRQGGIYHHYRQANPCAYWCMKERSNHDLWVADQPHPNYETLYHHQHNHWYSTGPLRLCQPTHRDAMHPVLCLARCSWLSALS